MSEINNLFKQCEELSREKLVQISREVKDLELRIGEIPIEIIGYRPLQDIRDLKSSIEDSINDLEDR